MKNKFILMLILTIVLGGQAIAEKLEPDELILASEAIVMPLDRILLIKRAAFHGAIKLVGNEERKDGRYGKYLYFQYHNGSFELKDKGEVSYRKIEWNLWNKILYKFLWFHPDPFDFADFLKFENFKLVVVVGHNHLAIYFWNKDYVVDEKVRLAPTVWSDISEVDLNDKRIQWFKYDENRKKQVIKIENMWKGKGPP